MLRLICASDIRAMAVKVRIPTPLQHLTCNQAEVICAGNTLAEVLSQLESAHPGITGRICDESGQVQRFVNIYLNGEDVRFREGVATPVVDGDEVAIVPAIAGG